MQRNRTEQGSDEAVRGAPSQTDRPGQASSSRSEEFLKRSYSMHGPDEAVSLYKDWAPSYDQQLQSELGYLSPKRVADLAAEWVVDRAAPVLDVGCGTGLTGAAMKFHGYTTIDGVDISPEMIALAQAKGIYREIFEADLLKPLPLASDAYGAAVSSGTFTHAHVGAVALDEVFRVLRPGGLLVCTIHTDVFEPAGFRAKIASLTVAGRIAVRHRHEAALFEGEAPDGLYYVIEVLGA
ncbi:class I SAM-dependent DNA methyltransferase [Rhodoligotrophos ferricapiens]|uniref:class I SAM-dependent DNA methyltransferase n=1 Tax=Rhodoligotrophos ferricapiens TaxID=3069264 RepID=UPI00315CE8CB